MKWWKWIWWINICLLFWTLQALNVFDTLLNSIHPLLNSWLCFCKGLYIWKPIKMIQKLQLGKNRPPMRWKQNIKNWKQESKLVGTTFSSRTHNGAQPDCDWDAVGQLLCLCKYQQGWDIYNSTISSFCKWGSNLHCYWRASSSTDTQYKSRSKVWNMAMLRKCKLTSPPSPGIVLRNTFKTSQSICWTTDLPICECFWSSRSYLTCYEAKFASGLGQLNNDQILNQSSPVIRWKFYGGRFIAVVVESLPLTFCVCSPSGLWFSVGLYLTLQVNTSLRKKRRSGTLFSAVSNHGNSDLLWQLWVIAIFTSLYNIKIY